jgi:hypothetical protein
MDYAHIWRFHIWDFLSDDIYSWRELIWSADWLTCRLIFQLVPLIIALSHNRRLLKHWFIMHDIYEVSLSNKV